MREIKFRAWDKKHPKMHYGDIRIVFAYPDKDIVIMQYTGLKDKNGMEIYEGDIIKWLGGAVETVDWFNVGWNLDESGSHSVEVIGNIYENPELVKEGKLNDQ